MIRRICLCSGIVIVAAASVHAAGVPRFNHVVVVIMADHSPSEIYNSTSAPYINGALIPDGAKFTHASTPPGLHPSQPNYIALFAGDPLGVTSDTCPQTLTAMNLAQQLTNAGLSFAQYSEGLPTLGEACTGTLYTRAHNPVADFAALPPSMNRPFSQFATDLSNDALPTVSFVVPNLCHDMHGDPVSCNASNTDVVKLGDTWLSNTMPPVLSSAATRHVLLIVTWDQGSGSSDQIPMIFAGDHLQPGYVSGAAVTHYNVLRTIEDMYGLTSLGNAATAAPITDVWDDALFSDGFE